MDKQSRKLVIALALCTGIVAGDSIAQAAPQQGLRMTFEDTFDQLSVSNRCGTGATWFNRTPWNGDFGQAAFAGSTNNNSFSTDNGILTITLRKNAQDKWTSGLLSSLCSDGSGFAQQYGYFEMRAQFPTGEGVWPAFWLIGAERLLPESDVTAEIDIVEHYGALPQFYSSKWHIWHRDGSGQHETDYQRRPVETGSLSEGFHTYGVRIDAEQTTFYFNGEPHWSVPTPSAHHQPMMLLANLGLGGGWPVGDSANNAEMKIDYIRVYALE